MIEQVIEIGNLLSAYELVVIKSNQILLYFIIIFLKKKNVKQHKNEYLHMN